jgi:hypothetical protein
MDHNKTHFHKTTTTNNSSNATKADRKREQKAQAKETENSACTFTTKKEKTGGDQDSTSEEEEEESETSANTAKQFKKFKTTEGDDFTGLETTSASTPDAQSQGFGENHLGATMSTTTSCSTNEFLPVGERLAALYNGILMSRETQNGRGGSKGLRFRCANSHEFTISFSKMEKVPHGSLELETCKDIWCVKCHNFYYRCMKKAESNGAVVTSHIFEKGHVSLNCRMGHNFKISIHRNPDKVWCPDCKKDVKNETKRQREIEIEKQKQKQFEHQQKLFEESKKHLEDNQQKQQRKSTLSEILAQVELKAQYETQQFMASNSSTCDAGNAYQVFKIIYMPREILQASFQSVGDGLNSCFRKMAILVHPDKNSHPLANRAFQKLSQVYSLCANRG